MQSGWRGVQAMMVAAIMGMSVALAACGGPLRA
jgi:predicted small lipoprotein YifL